MSVLWRRGSGTVAEVQAELEDLEELEPAYTTVLTQLRSLCAKRWVTAAAYGPANRYYPIEPRSRAANAALERVRYRYFDGSHEGLLTHLVCDRATFPAVLRRVRQVLDDRLRQSEQGQIASRRSQG